MTTFEYPSEPFPSVPRLSIFVPDSWLAEPTPAALMLMYDSASPPGFTANALVRVQRVKAPLDFTAVVDEANQKLNAKHPDLAILRSEELTHRGFRAAFQVHEFTPTDASVRVQQQQLVIEVEHPGPGLVDLLQLHLSCSSDEAERYESQFEEIRRSLSVDAAVASARSAR